MAFNDNLERLRNPGEDGLPETIYDDLLADYTHDTSTRDAKIAELSESHAASLAEVERLKAANYDLHNLIPPADGETESSGDTVEEVQGIESLFEIPTTEDD